jgi:hypothetical protein
MPWTWERLSTVVRRLKLPAGEYVVGRVGHGLSRDRSSSADRVELLVTETGWKRLKERGWREQSGGAALRHPDERGLTAARAELAEVRHQVAEVDGVPVVAVDPGPPTAPRETWRQRVGTTAFVVVFTCVLGSAAYGLWVFYPSTAPSVVARHLTFQTTEVQATVDDWTSAGTCEGGPTYGDSDRIRVTLSWTQDGRARTADYTSCNASVDSPQAVWVTGDGVVASQDSPWVDHIWPAFISSMALVSAVVLPLLGRVRGWLYRRRRRA